MFDGFERHVIGIGDVSLLATVGGNAPRLLLLHGSPETDLMWREIAPILARRFTVLRADLRGYGERSSHAAGHLRS